MLQTGLIEQAITDTYIVALCFIIDFSLATFLSPPPFHHHPNHLITPNATSSTKAL